MMTHNETELAETYDAIMETIEDNKDWMETNMAAIENWRRPPTEDRATQTQAHDHDLLESSVSHFFNDSFS